MSNRNFRMGEKHWSLGMWNRIKGWLGDLTERVEDIEEGGGGGGGGQMNVIESISVNGVNIPPVNKNVALSVPTKTSDLTNDSGFMTASRVIATAARISLPSAGSSVSYSLQGLTANHMLFLWNFSYSAENNPTVNLTWETYDGYFTITNTSIDTSSQSIQPVFVLPEYVAATQR